MGGTSAVAPAILLWLGLLLGRALSPIGATCACAMALGCGWLAVRAPARVGTVALLAAIALAAAARGAGHHARLDAERAWLARSGDAPIRIAARVVEPPPRESGQPVAVVALLGARPALPAATRVRLALPRGSDAEWGDVIAALARLDVPSRARNPGGFDPRAGADASAVAASGRAYFAVVAPGRGAWALPRATFARWRRAIDRRLDAGLSPPARELVVPLVTGDRSALSTDLSAQLRAAGLIHLLALSGLHVVWLAALTRGVCGALGGGIAARALGGIACAVFYAGIAGPLPSLMRAVVGEAIGGIARLTGRAIDPLQALALAVVALLPAAPGWADDLGFQLSCAATLGLVTVGPWLDARATRGRVLATSLIPTASAQLTAAPVLLARMHAASWPGALANLAAVPVSGLLLAGAWLAVAAEVAVPGAGAPWFSACEVLAAALRTIAGTAARAPAALMGTGHEPGIAWLAAAGAALLAGGLREPRDLVGRAQPATPARAIATACGAWACALALVLALTVRPLRPRPGHAWVVAIDVGQGDAIALAFPEGWWLVDAGPRSPFADAGESAVLPFFRWCGVRRLDRLVLTHDDSDHTGGATAVRRALAVERILAAPAWPGHPGPAARFGARAVARGDALRRDPAVCVRWPPRPDAAGADSARVRGDNDAGVVLELVRGRTRALLLADVDSTVEEALDVAPDVMLLKVAHHGSASSSGARFLQRIRPRVSVLSVGRRNPFGHPAPSALVRLAATGTEVHRTDREGALWFDLSDTTLASIAWRDADAFDRLNACGARGGSATAPRVP